MENSLRLLCDRLSLPYNNKDFPEYYSLLNEDDVMAKQWVYCTKTDSTLSPLQIDQGCPTPFWWRGYNGTKHKLPDGLKQGNLKNTLYAVAASYTLLCMSYYILFSDEGFLKNSSLVNSDVLLGRDNEVIRTSLDPKPISELFFYQTVFSKGADFRCPDE